MASSRVMTAAPLEEPDDLDVRVIASERLTVFVDAVIAIAVTLLALDLPKPIGNTNAALLHSAYDQRAGYMAFVISFLVIAAHWRAHHSLFRYVTRLDGRVAGLTMAWLFMQVVTPFATAVITGNGGFQVRFGFYAAVQVTAFILFSLIVREIQRRRLHRADIPPHLFSRIYLRTIGVGLGFAVSIPISFVTGWAYLCWIVAPFVTLVVHRRILSRASVN